MDIVDFHSHILPALDHGSSSVDTSLSQLRLASNHGIKRVVATSHYYPYRENPDRFIGRRARCYDALISARTEDMPDVVLGAEVLICDNIEEMPLLDRLCIGGTRALLLELPFTDFSKSHYISIKSLIREGYDVILAHADRYDPDNINALVNLGAKIQLNVDSLCGLFIKRHLLKWIEAGSVVALGSDIHGPDNKAYVRFEKAIKKLGGRAEIIKINSDKYWSVFEK